MTRTLLLNASEEPLHILPAKRAIRLMLAEKAEMVEASGVKYRSQYEEIDVPSILRLRKYVHVPYRASIPLTTRTILARDNYVCAYCGGVADTKDHILPTAKGGKHTWENVVASCRRCNHKKGQKTLEQWGRELKFQPTVPRGIDAWVLTFSPEESWLEYLSPSTTR